MSELKRRAQQLLGEMLDDAATVLKGTLRQTIRVGRGQPKPDVVARFVFAAALELEEVSDSGESAREGAVGAMSVNELAAKREQLRLARLAERKQA